MVDISEYIKWNSALYHHFFSNENDDDEIFLYVTKDVINKIGTEEKLGTVSDFLNVVCMPKNQRAAFYSELYHLYVTGGRLPKVPYTDSSIFRFATCLIDEDINKHIPCAFLNFIILAVLIVSEAQSNDISAIGKHLSSYLINKIGDSGSRDALEDLFEALNYLHPSFKNYSLTAQRYVGLLKYQLVLSDKQIEKIKESLYRNGFEFDDDTSYSEKVLRIIDYVDDDIKQLLKVSLNSIPHQKRIDDIINNFDPEDYAATHSHVGQRKIVGTFVHCLYFGDDDNRLVLLTDVRNTPLNRDGYIIHSEYIDFIGPYNPHHVLKNGKDKVIIENHHVSTDTCSIRSIGNDGIVFFKRYNDIYYIESHSLCDSDTFIAVTDKKLSKWKAWAEQHTNQYFEVEAENVLPILGSNWHLFNSSGFDSPFYKETIEVDGRKIQVNKSQIVMKGGIIPNNKKNVYLSNALPYFEFPVKIDIDKLSIYVNINNEIADENKDYQIFISDGNKLVIDVLDNTLSSRNSHEIDIQLEYKSEVFKGNYHAAFSICGQEIKYAHENLFKYDKWSQIINEDTISNQYISGNIVHGGVTESLRGVATNLLNLFPLVDQEFPSFYFINLLAACCYMNEGRSITSRVLEKCIRYSATRTQINYLSDDKFVSRLRNLLVNSGYICPSYSGRTLYQAMPPTFIKIPAPPILEGKRGATFMYMLGGCYTRHFITDLMRFCESHQIDIKIKKLSSSISSGALSLLPPIILLDNKFDPCLFISETKNLCEYNKGDLALEMLNILPSIKDYQQTLSPIVGEMNIKLLEADGNKFPRIRTSIAEGYNRSQWLETKENTYLQPKVREYAWMNLFCRFKQNRPMLLFNTTGDISFPENIHLPYLLQRALFIMNIGQPQYQKVFICNNNITENPLYARIKTYRIGTGQNRLERIVTMLTNGRCDSANALIRHSCNIRNYTIELWTRKERFSHLPKYILAIKQSTSIYEALAYGSSVYINKGGKFTRVDGGPNQVFTKLMTNRGTWEQLGIRFYEDTFNCPLKEDYFVEKLDIK